MKKSLPLSTSLLTLCLIALIVSVSMLAGPIGGLWTAKASMQQGPGNTPAYDFAEGMEPGQPKEKKEEPGDGSTAAPNPNAINAGTYAFTSASGASLEDMSSGTTMLLTPDLDDAASSVAPVGFDFWFDGVRQTFFSVNANGLMKLGQTPVTTAFTNDLASATNVPQIATYWDDLWIGNNGKVHYKLVGTAPNRKLVVEWQNMQIPRVAAANTGAGTFQAWLYESTGKIEFVYGSGVGANAANSGYSVGFGSSATQFVSITTSGPTAAYGTANNTNTGAITSGTKYTFSPNVPADPSALSYTAVGLNTMTLNWTDNATNEVGYVVYRSLDGVSYEFVRQLAANSTSSIEGGLASNTTYFWKVFPVTEGSLSATAASRRLHPDSQGTTTGTLSGTRTIGPTGNYATIGAAVTDINTSGLAGNLILELQATYVSTVETFPLVINTLGSPSNTITLRPTTGATALSITSAGTQTLNLNGATYVTIDGRAGGAGGSQLTIANTSIAGVPIQFINDARNNLVEFATVQGVNTSTTGGDIVFSTTTGSIGNSNNTVDNCDIKDGATTPVNGIYSLGTTGVPNSNNTISSNLIHEFFSAGTVTNGILLSSASGNLGNLRWTISNNKLFQTPTRTYTTGNIHAGISIGANTGSTVAGFGHTISGNTIGFASSAGTGIYTMAGTIATRFIGINLNVGDEATSVQNNTIAGFSLATSSGATTTNGIFSGINVLQGNVNIGTTTGNTIGSGTTTGSITTTPTTTLALNVGISVHTNASVAAINISNNTIGGFTANGSGSISGIAISQGQPTISSNTIGSNATALSMNSPTVAVASTQLNGINIQTGTAPAGVVSPTTISNNIIANFSGAGTGTTAVGRGIVSSGTGPATISSNTVHDIASASTNTTVAGGGTAVQGILQTGAAALGASVDQNTVFTISATNATAVSTVVAGIGYSNPTNGTVTKNKIYDLRNASTGTTVTAPPMAIGILIRAALGLGGTFSNNMISLGSSQTTNTQFEGMMNSFVTAGVFAYYNSVHIAGAAAAGALPSHGFLRGDNGAASAITTVVDIRNNILNNTRTGGTGKHYAIGNVNSVPATGWGTNASNFNVLNSASAATIGIWGLATDETFAAWKVASASDASSLSGVPVTFTAPATGDLHLNFGVTPTSIESGGTAIAGLTIDYDMQTRPGPAGSVNGGALAPDIGADEFDGVPLDITAPSIAYTPLTNTTFTTDRTLTAMIADASGVATGGLAPRIYYRKNAGAYVSRAGSLSSGTVINGTWMFPIVVADVGGVTAGDVISYFVIAQDVAGNISSNPGGAVATDVNNVSTPPASPNSYMILAPFASSVNVGTGETITSLTNAGGLFAQLNSAVLTSSVIVNLTSDLTGETGSVALNQWTEEGAGNYTVTIKPSGVARSITSTAAAVSVIKINDADRFTIDGSLSGGTDRSLTISNINTAASTAVIWVASAANGAQNNTIKNCVLSAGADQSTGTAFTFGIVSSSSAAILTGGLDNDNDTYSNNLIKKANVGIASLGASSANMNQNTTISNNQIGPASFGADEIGTCGILFFNENAANITGNEVRFVGDLAFTGGGSGRDRVGIEIGGTTGSWSSTSPGTTVPATNCNISGNRIHDISDQATFSAVGIVVNASNGGSPTANTVANNMIYNVIANGTSPDQGVGIGISNGNGDKVAYNSVYLAGDIDPGAATSADRGTFGLSVISTGVLNLNLRDNISVMDISSNTGSLLHAAINIPTGFAWGTGGSNFNDWFAPAANTQARVGCVGNTPGGTFHATLASWQTATTQDAASISADPLFIAVPDFHLQPTSPAIMAGNGTGTGVTTDADNDPRPASNPDIGADELVQAVAGSIPAGTFYNAKSADGDSLAGNVSITNVIYLNGKLSTGASTLSIGCNATVSGGGASNYVIGNLKKTYCATGSKSFEVGTANGFSPVTVNVTAGTFPADFTTKAVQGAQPNLAVPAKALSRYWTLTATGVTADLTFTYLDPPDVPGTATEANFVIFKYNGSFSMPGGTVDTMANTASITGVTSFSDWTLAEPSAEPCPLSTTPTSQNFPLAGGSNSFMVTADGGCIWNPVPNAVWITIDSVTAPSGGHAGNGTVNYSVAANNGPARMSTVTIGVKTFTVTQDGCSYMLDASSHNFNAPGGSSTVAVTTTATCAWTAVSNDAFIIIDSGTPGTGNGTVNYHVGNNTGPMRTGTMTIAGITFTVTQDAACAYMLSSMSQNFVAAGGMNSVDVLTGTGCTWNAVSNDAFIVVDMGASGTGPGTVNYHVTANVGPMRMGTMTIAGITFTVTQDGGCMFTLSRNHQSFAGNGGSGSVDVIASDSACPWTASTAATFIHITSGTPGTGNGTLQYTVDANPGPGIRNSTITIAGETYTVYQGIDFLDVPSNALFYTEIGKLAARGVTLGCGGGNYCPDDQVLRDQMAAFIMRAKGEFNPPTPGSQRFVDVPPENAFYKFIDRLAELQITLGCTATMYCPADAVKREQMAAFIIRGLGEFNPPTPGSQRFVDVPPENPFYKFIDRMAVLNITLGCSPTMYCPNDIVTRRQMAAFLVRAFDL